MEGIELKCPVIVEKRALRTDSAGPGKHRGGLGIDTQVKNLVEGRWNFEQTRRAVCPPWGLWGGGDGDPSAYLLRLPGENDFKMMVGAHIPVPVNASAIVRTGGGGGWGDPYERDPHLVRADVLEELVSREAARTQYGVVLRDDFSIDAGATAKARSSARPRESGNPMSPPFPPPLAGEG
jgi:N-methylhydantoinase B